MEDYLQLAVGTWQFIVKRITPAILNSLRREKLFNSSVMAPNVKNEVVPVRNMETALRATVIFVPQSSRTLKGQNLQSTQKTTKKQLNKRHQTNLNVVSFQLKSILLTAVVGQYCPLPFPVEILKIVYERVD